MHSTKHVNFSTLSSQSLPFCVAEISSASNIKKSSRIFVPQHRGQLCVFCFLAKTQQIFNVGTVRIVVGGLSHKCSVQVHITLGPKRMQEITFRSNFTVGSQRTSISCCYRGSHIKKTVSKFDVVKSFRVNTKFNWSFKS